MKLKFLNVLAITTLSINVFGQNESPIMKLPAKANGYLLLENEANLVKYWRIDISDSVTNPINGQKEFESVYKNELWGTNHVYIPQNLRSNTAMITVQGFNAANELVDTDIQAVGPQPPSNVVCEMLCVGDDYVYAIKDWKNPNTLVSHLEVGTPSSPPANYPYYYEWIAAVDWVNNTAMSHDSDPHYYGLSNFNTDSSSNNAQNSYIICLEVPYGSYLYNRFGDPINGQVYGIKKGFGPWKDNYFLKGAPFGIVDGCYDALTLPFIIDDINNHIHPNDIGPELGCNGYAHISDGETPEEPNIDDPCMTPFFDLLGGSAWSNNEGHTWTGNLVGQIINIPCEDNYASESPEVGPSSVLGNAFTWPENISRITLNLIDTDTPIAPIYLTKDLFFDAENNYIPNNIAFPKGFYIIGYQGIDLSYHAYYFENKEATTFNLNQANFVNYTAYPVPITTDQFNLTVQATQRVSFTFEIKNASGELLFSDNYEIEKGNTLEKSIEPATGIPVGQLFNKLIFKDGSEISFQTIKN
jgi:hypothetical protein